MDLLCTLNADLKEYSIYFIVVFATLTIIVGNVLCLKQDPHYFEDMFDPIKIVTFLFILLLGLFIGIVWPIVVLLLIFLTFVLPLYFITKYISLYIFKRL